MARLRSILACLGLAPLLAASQIPAKNPLVDAAQLIGRKGLTSAAAPPSVVTAFKPSGGRIYVKEYVVALSSDAAKGRPLIERSALVGEFNYGTTSTLQWQNVYSGATSMSVVSYGGTLNLRSDGSFGDTYSSATGQVGALGFYKATGKGTWSIQGDLLVLKYLAYNQGDGFHREEQRYRIAGVVVFSDGQKVVVLKTKITEPVNALTVGDHSEYFSTAKKE